MCTLQHLGLVILKGWDLPRLCMPPSSWLIDVSLLSEACERREGSRQKEGGEQGSEGGAKTRRWERSEKWVWCVVQEGGAP